MESYLLDTVVNYSNVNVTSIGKTHEDRDIYRVYIQSHNNNLTHLPKIAIDCGIHAREWVSPAEFKHNCFSLIIYLLYDIHPPDNLF